MERGFAMLSLDDEEEEEEVVQVQKGPDLVSKKEELCLTFNSNLILVHHLGKGEDLLKVPLIFVKFWVQIHDVPLGYFSDTLTRQMGDFIRKFLEYDGTNLGRRVRNHLHMRIQMDVRCPLERKKKGNNYEWAKLGRSKRKEENGRGSEAGGDKKKRPKRESDKFMEEEEVGFLVVRNRKMLEKSHVISAGRLVAMKIFSWNICKLGSLRAIRRF
ncbi:hypothetical protein Golob_022769, partial [Gossypium lobatum]|nr:hypothetical protein [Gossypium lobatum]